MIPKVKRWRVTTTHGVFIVLAPTKRLAVMNLRAEGIYHAIEKIGLSRRQLSDD